MKFCFWQPFDQAESKWLRQTTREALLSKSCSQGKQARARKHARISRWKRTSIAKLINILSSHNGEKAQKFCIRPRLQNSFEKRESVREPGSARLRPLRSPVSFWELLACRTLRPVSRAGDTCHILAVACHVPVWHVMFMCDMFPCPVVIWPVMWCFVVWPCSNV